MNGKNQLLEVSMGISDFSSEWLHCDRISSYVARVVSHDRADSMLYANLLSSALNELLETVFTNHGPEGDFSCRVSRSGDTDVIELTLPCDDETLRFYTDAADRLGQRDLGDIYRSALLASGEQDPHLGLLEVAVDYQAKISIAPENGRVRLAAEMVLEGAS
jgi:hypothetical protein